MNRLHISSCRISENGYHPIEASGHVRYNFSGERNPNEVYRLNITMVTMGSTGDVRPYVLLGEKLKNRGYHITIAAFSSFGGMITDAGLEFFPLSGSAEELITSVLGPETNGINYLPKICKNLRLVIPDLLKSLDESCRTADAMICNYFGSVYYSIAEKYNIPCIQTHFFPMDPTASIPMSSFRNQNLGPVFNRFTYKIGYLAVGTVEKFLLSERIPFTESGNMKFRYYMPSVLLFFRSLRNGLIPFI